MPRKKEVKEEVTEGKKIDRRSITSRKNLLKGQKMKAEMQRAEKIAELQKKQSGEFHVVESSDSESESDEEGEIIIKARAKPKVQAKPKVAGKKQTAELEDTYDVRSELAELKEIMMALTAKKEKKPRKPRSKKVIQIVPPAQQPQQPPQIQPIYITPPKEQIKPMDPLASQILLNY